MAESFTLERLQALCEQGDWSGAEDEAREIAYICRRNWLILNPQVEVKRPLPYQREPRHRISAFLCRLSRHRVIEKDEALSIVRRLVKCWSGAPSNTLRSFGHLDSAWSPGRYWRGEWRHDFLEEYSELTKLARENGWQFVDLKKRDADMRRKKSHELDRDEAALTEARSVLTGLNRAIRDRQAA